MKNDPVAMSKNPSSGPCPVLCMIQHHHRGDSPCTFDAEYLKGSDEMMADVVGHGSLCSSFLCPLQTVALSTRRPPDHHVAADYICESAIPSSLFNNEYRFIQNMRSLSSTSSLLYLVKRKATLTRERACSISGYLSKISINRNYFVAVLTIHGEEMVKKACKSGLGSKPVGKQKCQLLN